MKEYIPLEEATTIPVLPKGQRVEFRNTDEAFEAGWKTCQEYIATCIEPADVISRHEAIREIKKIFSPCGKAGNGDAISREVVLAKLRDLKNPEQDADPGYPPFGSCGDSVDIEDELRKFNTSPYQGTTGTISAPLNQQYCGQLLPCRICRMTMMQCPMQVQKYEVIRSSQTGTTGTVK